MDKQKEIWVKNTSNIEPNKCPKCREKSIECVFPFGDDFFFCCNPKCTVVRFRCNNNSNEGYYEITNASIETPTVEYVEKELIKKRPIL